MTEIKDTLSYYDRNAKTYFDSTVKGNMIESYNKFLINIPSGGYILDFGCGSGRDSKYFLDGGYKVKAVDGSSALCELATEYIGQQVECMQFSELSDISLYDGIWACASIIHIPTEELLKVLKKMSDALKTSGCIYTCFKNGVGSEIIDGRFFNYLTEENFINILNNYPELELIDVYRSNSVTNANETKFWNNFLIKKRTL